MTESIDSFLTFCNVYDIADESFGDIKDAIWSKIEKVMLNGRKVIHSMLININYFKDATLDTKLNSDMIGILKMSQPRTELNFKPIRLYYKLLSILKKDTGKVNRFLVGEVYENSGFKEDFDELVSRSVIDINQSIKSTKNSPEYNRLQKNSYKFDSLTTVALQPIVADLKQCDSLIGQSQAELRKLDKTSKNEKIRNLTRRMTVFFRSILNYCNFRISIIGRYLKYAKASIKGTIQNMKNKELQTRSDLKYHIPKMSQKTDKNNFFTIKGEYEKMRKATTYDEYKPSYDKVTSLLGISGYVIKQMKFIDESYTILFMAVRDDGEPISVSTHRLFHSSDRENLTELIPTFKSKSNTTFYPTPRIYAHLNVPSNRLGSSIQQSKEKGDTVLYELAQRVKTAYVDREIGKTAVFINTDKPLKIKKIDYNRYKKINETKLGLNDKGGQ